MGLDAPAPPGPVEDRRNPPRHRTTPAGWARENLFSSWPNSVLTVAFGAALAWAGYRVLRFAFVTADWEIVRRNLALLMVGRFPRDQLWRPVASAVVLAATIGLAVGAAATVAAEEARRVGRPPSGVSWAGPLRRWWPLLALGVILVSFARTLTPLLVLVAVVTAGAVAHVVGRRMPASLRRFTWVFVGVGLVLSLQLTVGFGGVGWDAWGGLHLTLFVTVVGIVLAFPLGLLLALGRRSNLPVVRAVSVAYIEVFRGVPLLTLLLMGQLMIGFFLPRGFTPPGIVVRAIVVIVLFEAAYIAEIARGGLQAVPRGQVEAAQALGLSPWRTTRLIVLPQALRAVIPAMVGQFISLYQDTSLLAAISLMELLDAGRSATSQPEFVGRGLQAVVLPFVGFIYWAVSYSMSRESRRLERRLGVGER